MISYLNENLIRAGIVRFKQDLKLIIMEMKEV